MFFFRIVGVYRRGGDILEDDVIWIIKVFLNLDMCFLNSFYFCNFILFLKFYEKKFFFVCEEIEV